MVAAVVVDYSGAGEDKKEEGKERRLTWHGERLVGLVVDRW